jgi:hypothetical protein
MPEIPDLSDLAEQIFNSFPDDVKTLRAVCDATDQLRKDKGEDDPGVQDGEFRANNLKGLFTRRIAWACYQIDARFGLRAKTGGAIATRPADGKTHATDALMWRPTGHIGDVMSDRNVSWGWKDEDKQPLDQWLQPLPEAGVATGPGPVTPPVTPDPVDLGPILARLRALEDRPDCSVSLASLGARVQKLEEKPDPPAAEPYELPKLVAVGKIPFLGTVKLPVQKA